MKRIMRRAGSFAFITGLYAQSPQNGKVVLEGYDALADAGGGLFYAVSGGHTGLIDINGNWVWRSDFES